MPRFIIDWRIEGHFTVEAVSTEEAQDRFDKEWGTRGGIDPLRDGEVSNDKPFRSDS